MKGSVYIVIMKSILLQMNRFCCLGVGTLYIRVVCQRCKSLEKKGAGDAVQISDYNFFLKDLFWIIYQLINKIVVKNIK